MKPSLHGVASSIALAVSMLLMGGCCVSFKGCPPSNPTEKTTVPNVKGELLSDALVTLHNARLRPGLILNPTNEYRNDKLQVTHQGEDPGTEVPVNTAISLSVQLAGDAAGYKSATLFNCSSDRREVTVWVSDSGAAWNKEGTLPAQYGASGICPDPSTTPLDLSFQSNHQYYVVAVDPQKSGCSGDDPSDLACIRWSHQLVGADEGASFQAVIS